MAAHTRVPFTKCNVQCQLALVRHVHSGDAGRSLVSHTPSAQAGCRTRLRSAWCCSLRFHSPLPHHVLGNPEPEGAPQTAREDWTEAARLVCALFHTVQTPIRRVPTTSEADFVANQNSELHPMD
eukprot:6470606-Amphidinium_carterae.1